MKSVLILGVGGTGSRAVNMLQKKILRMGKQDDVNIVSAVLDTNAADEKNIDTATIVSLSDNVTVKTVRERLGASVDDFFPKDSLFDSNNISIGAGQWRKQSYLAFLNAMAGRQKNNLDSALEKLADKSSPSISIDVYTVASLAGGTGSGSFIPLTLYVKKRIREIFGAKTTIHAKAMLACPDIYEGKQNDPLNITSIYANAYAILRELNAINQVVYGLNSANYDDGSGEFARAGRTPVRFHIGTKDSPVGVLFDSQDPAYHTPEAAPFERVCMMEKITGVSSIIAHDEALANTLYSLICTKAGGELDSIWSNEEKKRANETGHNCMYAGIGSSEIQYPIDEMMEYFAWRKTQADAEGAWLALHNATEAQIAEKRRLAKEMRKDFHMTVKDYAKFFTDAQKAEARTETCNVTELIRSSVMREVERGDSIEMVSILAEYWDGIKEALADLVPDHKPAAGKIASLDPVENPGLFGGKAEKEGKAQAICDNASQAYSTMNKYYHDAVEAINTQIDVTTDAILPIDTKKDPEANLKLSFARNVLQRDGFYIHPVAAMVQLCTFRLMLQEELSALTGSEWKDVGSYEIGKLPASLLSCTEDLDTLGLGGKASKSFYLKGGRSRFTSLLGDTAADAFKNQKTDYATDSEALLKDADMLLTKLHNEASEMLLRRVIEKLGERIDALIESYRSFFGRFAEQKDRLVDKVKRAEEDKAKNADTSCVYVGASIAQRQRHYELLMEESMTDEREGNSVAGESVFGISYKMACAKKGNAAEEERVDATGVFDAMKKANLVQLSKTDYCVALRARNVFEVLAEENRGHEYEAGKTAVQTAYEMAKPALQVATGGQHKNQAVVLAPKSVEEYLQKNTDRFGISISAACTDDLVTRWCPESFVRIEDTVPRNTIFICRALMSVNSVDIVKVNEKSGEDGYYKRYLEAVRIGEEQKNDSMFPHLGFNWHKRGYLPFINPDLEAEADKKMIKALLYAIMNGEITFSVQYSDKAFRYGNDKIVGDGKFVDENNLLGLIAWLRPQDDKIEKWCAEFDRNVEDQLKVLPKTGFVHEIPAAKAKLTTTKYLRMFRKNIFETIMENSSGSAQTVMKKDLNMSLFEFAYRIKVEEESRGGYDCNDAEKILKVVSDLLWELCERVVSSENDQFQEVYQWELDYFIAELYCDDDMPEKSAGDVARTMLQFANRAGCFMEISPSTDPAKGKWEKRPFDLNAFQRDRMNACVSRVMASKGGKAPAEDAPATEAPATEAPVEE
ncbi:MAG: hypothetical protein IJV96_03750 [Clostridia bacterium]|nr:hypothetical protein [Clostridia bacterium]